MSSDDENPVPDRRTSGPDEPADKLSERMERLKSQLEGTKPARSAKGKSHDSANSRSAAGIGQAFRLSSEFIAGVVVGAGVGYLVDIFFGTSPWGMIVFLLLGFAAAVLNVMRAAGMVAESQMRLKPAKELNESQHKEESDHQIEK